MRVLALVVVVLLSAPACNQRRQEESRGRFQLDVDGLLEMTDTREDGALFSCSARAERLAELAGVATDTLHRCREETWSSGSDSITLFTVSHGEAQDCLSGCFWEKVYGIDDHGQLRVLGPRAPIRAPGPYSIAHALLQRVARDRVRLEQGDRAPPFHWDDCPMTNGEPHSRARLRRDGHGLAWVVDVADGFRCRARYQLSKGGFTLELSGRAVQPLDDAPLDTTQMTGRVIGG